MSLLVVATILEGRQFPSKPKSEIYTTCKFAGELLNSDPVPHTSAPYFNTELAWELTKKTLHQHRLQRTPLKLTFYTKGLAGVEEVGHIMLDLRSISSEAAAYKWHSLARCKYRTHKPQIRLMLATEDVDDNQPKQEGVPAEPKKLFVSLDQAEGCYQVGTPDPADPVYVLSLTVIAAVHLNHLIDNSRPAAFFFRFNLLDNVVTNSSFVNTLQPDFPIERVSVKLRGKLDNIYKYLASERTVSIQLCQGEEVIGVTDLLLTSLLTANEEGDCINSYHSCLSLRHPINGDVEVEDRPSAEVHFTLREEPKVEKMPLETVKQYADSNLVRSPEVPQRLSFDSPPRPRSVSPPTSTLSPSPELYEVPEDCRIWLCNLQLNNAKLSKSGKRYIRYIYPFFGTDAPHATSAVQFMAGDTTPLPPSQCGYSFAATLTAVHEQFNKVPLVLQLWNKTQDSDYLEGTSVISLSTLLKPGLQHMFGKVVSRTSDDVLGDIQISGWLEEKGPAPKHVVTEPKQQKERLKTAEPERERPEYRAALELELWKELKQEEFLRELELRADAKMRQISAEWQRKEADRDEEVRRQITEYTRLKDKMRGALRDLETREQALVNQERKLAVSQEDLARERVRLTSDVREASRRVEDEFEHKLRLQKQKLVALEQQNRELLEKVEEAETRLEKRSEELLAVREAQLTAPSTRIQTELEILRMEKAEMERKVTSLEKAKVHYKDSWTKALKELINVRERAQQDVKKRLHQEQTLMEHARLRYLSLEDNKLKGHMNTEVEDLKKEISKLKDTTTDQIPQKEANPDSMDKIGRLIEERNSLLNTGVYTKNDALIKELDDKIAILRS